MRKISKEEFIDLFNLLDNPYRLDKEYLVTFANIEADDFDNSIFLIYNFPEIVKSIMSEDKSKNIFINLDTYMNDISEEISKNSIVKAFIGYLNNGIYLNNGMVIKMDENAILKTEYRLKYNLYCPIDNYSLIDLFTDGIVHNISDTKYSDLVYDTFVDDEDFEYIIAKRYAKVNDIDIQYRKSNHIIEILNVGLGDKDDIINNFLIQISKIEDNIKAFIDIIYKELCAPNYNMGYHIFIKDIYESNGNYFIDYNIAIYPYLNNKDTRYDILGCLFSSKVYDNPIDTNTYTDMIHNICVSNNFQLGKDIVIDKFSEGYIVDIIIVTEDMTDADIDNILAEYASDDNYFLNVKYLENENDVYLQEKEYVNYPIIVYKLDTKEEEE